MLSVGGRLCLSGWDLFERRACVDWHEERAGLVSLSDFTQGCNALLGRIMDQRRGEAEGGAEGEAEGGHGAGQPPLPTDSHGAVVWPIMVPLNLKACRPPPSHCTPEYTTVACRSCTPRLPAYVRCTSCVGSAGRRIVGWRVGGRRVGGCR